MDRASSPLCSQRTPIASQSGGVPPQLDDFLHRGLGSQVNSRCSMKLLITALLTLIPLTVSAESLSGVTVGPPTIPHAGGTYSFGMHSLEGRIPESRFPHVRGLHGRMIRPMIGSALDPKLTIINIQFEPKEELPPSPPKPPAPAKFWIARCGSVVELQVGPTTKLIEEEQKGCPN